MHDDHRVCSPSETSWCSASCIPNMTTDHQLTLTGLWWGCLHLHHAWLLLPPWERWQKEACWGSSTSSQICSFTVTMATNKPAPLLWSIYTHVLSCILCIRVTSAQLDTVHIVHHSSAVCLLLQARNNESLAIRTWSCIQYLESEIWIWVSTFSVWA